MTARKPSEKKRYLAIWDGAEAAVTSQRTEVLQWVRENHEELGNLQLEIFDVTNAPKVGYAIRVELED